MSTEQPILSISELSITIEDDNGGLLAVSDLSLDIKRGQTVALVGESGSGKTLTALAVLRLLPTPPARITSGTITFDQKNLLELPEKEMRLIRGDRIAMIFQEPASSLNPLMPVGEQIGEAIRLHKQLDRKSVREQVLSLMETVGIPDPQRRYRSYPHQLSGGIRQRVVVATALSCRPDILLADEPTSALDTTVQAQIVDLLSRLIRDLGMGVLLITHDLGVVAALADRVVVIFDGHVVEEGSASEILSKPRHPYTRSLLAARALSGNAAEVSRLLSMEFASRPEGGPKRCPFIALCPDRQGACGERTPELIDLGPGRKVRCLLRGKNDD
jgi:oligopeptide/dipeptide ABC transporter ATP-binding protein